MNLGRSYLNNSSTLKCKLDIYSKNWRRQNVKSFEFGSLGNLIPDTKKSALRYSRDSQQPSRLLLNKTNSQLSKETFKDTTLPSDSRQGSYTDKAKRPNKKTLFEMLNSSKKKKKSRHNNEIPIGQSEFYLPFYHGTKPKRAKEPEKKDTNYQKPQARGSLNSSKSSFFSNTKHQDLSNSMPNQNNRSHQPFRQNRVASNQRSKRSRRKESANSNSKNQKRDSLYSKNSSGRKNVSDILKDSSLKRK